MSGVKREVSSDSESDTLRWSSMESLFPQLCTFASAPLMMAIVDCKRALSHEPWHKSTPIAAHQDGVQRWTGIQAFFLLELLAANIFFGRGFDIDNKRERDWKRNHVRP